jgi:hypothetical protein
MLQGGHQGRHRLVVFWEPWSQTIRKSFGEFSLKFPRFPPFLS